MTWPHHRELHSQVVVPHRVVVHSRVAVDYTPVGPYMLHHNPLVVHHSPGVGHMDNQVELHMLVLHMLVDSCKGQWVDNSVEHILVVHHRHKHILQVEDSLEDMQEHLDLPWLQSSKAQKSPRNKLYQVMFLYVLLIIL